MTAGSALATLALLPIAAAPTLAVFGLGWLLAGIAMAATFYQPGFAALTRWWGEHRVRALTTVTLAGGLASTVFAPLTAAQAGHLSWRATYTALTVVLAAVTIPAHALALRGPWPPAPPPGASKTGHDSSGVARSRPFLLLAAAFTLSGFAMYAVAAPTGLLLSAPRVEGLLHFAATVSVCRLVLTLRAITQLRTPA